jgi:outer membrane receptor protein involved in Fe transport
MTRALRRGALLGSISAIAMAGTALAAATDQQGTEQVVVTATKRTEALKDVPMSVTVVGGDALEKLNARGIQDLLATVPGLSLNDASPTHPDIILRGINAGGTGSTVASYIDETPFGSSNALANGGDTSPNIDTYDLARVEVLRGPQGTLYGASAEGGLIKYVTNVPDLAGFDASMELGGFDLDHGGWGGSVRGMVNVPVSDDLAVRGVFFYQRSPGFIDNAFTGQNHTDDFTSIGGRLSALYQVSSKLSVRLTAMMQDLKAGNIDAEDVVLVGDGFRPKYGDYVEQRVANELSGVRYYLYNATANWDLDWATLTSSTSYGLLHDRVVQDATAVYGAFVQGFVKQGKFTQEVRLASDPGQGPLEWLVGGYYTNETSTLNQAIVLNFHGPLLFPGAFLALDSDYNEIAGFATATYHFSPSFDLSFGGRYSHNSQNANQTDGAPAILGPPQTGASSESVFTWSTTARYHLDEDTMIYGRVATGFRPGGPNVEPVGGVGGVPSFYGSDSLINYEVGAKGSVPDANLSFDADVFLINWDNIQLLTLINNTGVNTNGGTARSQGAEADVTWTPVDGLTLNLNGAYTDAHLTQDTDLLLTGGRTGDPLPWAPKFSTSLSADYRFTPTGDFTPFVGATWHYIGTRHSDFIGQLVQLGYGVPRSQYTIPSYNTFDLRGGLDWNNWEVELYAKNLGGSKGVTSFSPYGISAASADPGGGLGAASVAVIQPRLVGADLRWKF